MPATRWVPLTAASGLEPFTDAPSSVSGSWAAASCNEVGVRLPRCTRLRSAALRSWAISLSRARSNAAIFSSAAASARIDRSLGPYGDLYPTALSVLSLVPLRRKLDLHADHPIIQLLQLGDLVLDVGAERIRHCAVPALHDNIHVNLRLPLVRACAVRSAAAGCPETPVRKRRGASMHPDHRLCRAEQQVHEAPYTDASPLPRLFLRGVSILTQFSVVRQPTADRGSRRQHLGRRRHRCRAEDTDPGRPQRAYRLRQRRPGRHHIVGQHDQIARAAASPSGALAARRPGSSLRCSEVSPA